MEGVSRYVSSIQAENKRREIDSKRRFCAKMGVEIKGDTGFDLESAYLDAKEKELKLIEKKRKVASAKQRIDDKYGEDPLIKL